MHQGVRPVECRESANSIVLTITKPTDRYFNELLRCNCLTDLLDPRKKLFPNAKEITESFAAFNAVRRWMKSTSFGDDTIRMFDVACGSTPRTAAVFAFRTKWSCTAIDPNVNEKDYGVARLTCIKDRIENVDIPSRKGTTVITAVHAHVPLDTILEVIEDDRIVLVGMPCCVPLHVTDENAELVDPDRTYVDLGIWSEKRTIKIWDIRRK